MNALSTFSIHPNMCHCIQILGSCNCGSCKYWDKGSNYRNTRRSFKIKCKSPSPEDNDNNTCYYCCTFCCTSKVYLKEERTKSRPKKHALRFDAIKGDKIQPSDANQFHDVGFKDSQNISKEKLVIIGRNCNNEGSEQKTSDDDTLNKNIKFASKQSIFWKKHNRVYQYMEKHKCNHCEKLSTRTK